jgi:hypothetical protein
MTTTTTGSASTSAGTGTGAAERSSVSERARRWQAYLLAEVDGASLALFRVLLGSILVWDVLRYFYHGRVHRHYIEPRVHFVFISFIEPWPGDGMVWHFAFLGAFAVLCAAGLYYRAAAPLLCAAFTYVFLIEKAEYLNHFYMVCLLTFLMSLAPAHRAFSLDRVRWIRAARGGGPAPPGEGVPRWALLVMRLQVALVYFYGGIAKLNADWLQGRPLNMWLPERSHLPVVGPLLAEPATALVVSYSGLLIDLGVPFLLLWRRGLPVGIVLCVMFNLMNAFLFSIGIFPYTMIAALVLFPDPGWPRRMLQASPFSGAAGAIPSPGAAARVMLGFLHVYMLAQLLVPLRHWLYPGDVAWNEAGHRFSWRMKLRDKDATKLQFYLIDPRTGVRQMIELKDWLTQRQIDEMGGRPDMIVDFAYMVADRWEAAVGVRPKITANVMASLNGAPERELVDSTLDLASVPRGIRQLW